MVCCYIINSIFGVGKGKGRGEDDGISSVVFPVKCPCWVLLGCENAVMECDEAVFIC